MVTNSYRNCNNAREGKYLPVPAPNDERRAESAKFDSSAPPRPQEFGGTERLDIEIRLNPTAPSNRYSGRDRTSTAQPVCTPKVCNGPTDLGEPVNHRLIAATCALGLSAVLASCSAPPTPNQSRPDGGTAGGGRAPVKVVRPPSAAPGGGLGGAFPGDVASGTVRWGASIGGNADPVSRHESVAGQAMGLRRTFFNWDQRTGSMVNTARADIAAGRLPWVSIKTPGWAAMASGSLDGEIDQMIRALDALDGPVWLTVHHEPEGGGGVNYADDAAGPAGWRAMQVKVRERLDTLGADNIAFASILMSWTFDPRSGRNPTDWWVDGIFDFAGIDHYVYDESFPGMGVMMWDKVREFYSARGTKIAVGEWGNRGTNTQAAAEMRAWYDTAIASNGQIIGLAAFDSNLNSPDGGWELFGDPLNTFRALMRAPSSIGVRQGV